MDGFIFVNERSYKKGAQDELLNTFFLRDMFVFAFGNV